MTMPDSYKLLPFPALPSCKLHTPADYGYFDESQVYGYARDYALANIAPLRAELEALRKRCEAVEARVAMAMHVLDKIDAGLGGETDDVRDALDPDNAIAAAQEPSHG